MKRSIINKFPIVYFIFIFLSCQQQHETLVYYRTDDEFAKREWFDIEDYWSNEKNGEYDIYIDNEDTLRITYSYTNNVTYSKDVSLKKEGNIIRQTTSFFLSGEISSKWQFWDSKFSFVFGKSYYFDKSGNIIIKEDFDHPYTFTFEEVKKIIQINHFESPYISRRIDSLQTPIWEISGRNSLHPEQYRQMTLHGKTGEILKNTIYY